LEAQLRSRQHDDTASTRNYNARGKSSGFEFLDSLVPSYLSIDIDGRVVRLDTFSKSIAPGCRLGWLTAQPKVVERITRITETTTQFPSGFVQAMVAQLIMGGQEHSKGKPTTASGWGVDGWVRWLEGLRGGYERRMQSMCTILEKGKFTTEDDSRQHESSSWQIIDKRQMFDFDFPRGGMFVWIQLHLESHVLWGQIAPEELATALWKYLMRKPYLCLTAPGFMFAPTDEVKRQAWRYLRITFAPMDESEVERAAHSLVEGMSDFWQIKSLDELPDDDDDN
jgi:DNA-binding transcriptional MocR family regulator